MDEGNKDTVAQPSDGGLPQAGSPAEAAPSNITEQLSKHERKKLKQQQYKQEQHLAHTTFKRKKFLKNLLIYGITFLVIGGLGYFFFASGEIVTPTIDDDPSIGPVDAPLTIIEFGDFQCPFTRNFNSGAFNELLTEYEGNVRWVFRDMVTGKHLYSTESANAAQCANEQGKYWEYFDILFERKAADEQSLKSYAQQLQLDIEKFNDCYDSERYFDEIKKDYKDGRAAGVTKTPTFFVNGYKVPGDVSAAQFKPLLDELLRMQNG